MITPQNNYKNFTILYVEDEDVIRKNVESCLSYVFNVLEAKDGCEGLDLFKNNKVDLVITDINMPGKDGIEMLEEIKEINPGIPCIITSAFDLEDINRVNELLLSKYIVKPFDIKDLLDSSFIALNLR